VDGIPEKGPVVFVVKARGKEWVPTLSTSENILPDLAIFVSKICEGGNSLSRRKSGGVCREGFAGG